MILLQRPLPTDKGACSLALALKQSNKGACSLVENPPNIPPNTPFSHLQAKPEQRPSTISNSINDISDFDIRSNQDKNEDSQEYIDENIDEIDDLDEIEKMTKALFTDMQELIDEIPTDDDIPKPNLTKLSPKLSNDLQRYFEE